MSQVICNFRFYPGFAAFGILLIFQLFMIRTCEVWAEAPTYQEIRSITVEVVEIFDEPDIGLIYRTGNQLKKNTKEEVIRRELLIREGQVFDPFLLQESERNLRSLSFLNNISITPLHAGRYVDIIVRVQDTWTLFPFISLSSGGGREKTAVGIRERNLLGYGKRIEFLYADDEGREKIEGVWDDRRLFGTYQQLTIGHFKRSDGFRSFTTLGKPFRSLVEPFAWSIKADAFNLVGRLFQNGDERFIFRHKSLNVGTGFTYSKGNPEVSLRRYTLGYDYSNDRFSLPSDEDFSDVNVDPETVSSDGSLLAEDRRFSGPTLTYQRIEPDFISINFVDRFSRIEDFNLGNEFTARGQVALESLGSERDALNLQFNDSDGWRVSPTSFIRGELGGSLRVDEKEISNILLQARLKYFNILGPRYLGGMYTGKHTIASSVEFTFGEKLDKDFELLLGASNSLRGYKARTFTGEQRVVFNIEDRFHIFENIFRLVSVGGAVFLTLAARVAEVSVI